MEKMEVTIDQLGPRGDGFCKGENGRIYVDRSVPGDKLEIRLQSRPDGLKHGDILKIIKPSENRENAPCEHYDVCGGCTLQHVTQDYYQNWKQSLVREALNRQNVKPEKYLEPVFITGARRRRVTFSALKQKNGLVLGYNKRRSKLIGNIDHCLVADPDIMSLRLSIKDHLEPILKTRQAIDVFIQKINGIFDVVLTGQVGQKGTPDLSIMEMAAELLHKTKIARISWREKIQDEIEIIVEKEPLRISFGKLDVQLPPASFLQPTAIGQKALVEAVMKSLPKQGHFADLFCGCGTFSGAMLAHGSVDGYESNPNAIRALENAAKTTNASMRAYIRDLFRKPLTLEEINQYDAIVLDPPRAGALKQVTHLAKSNVKCLINISCNPVTFARDARLLTEGGYVLKSVKIVDQFTWSHHVELIGVYSKI